VVGLYPVVYHVTGGAHAMGDLATAAAVAALFAREDLLRVTGARDLAAMSSLLVLSSVSSKATLLLLGAAVMFAMGLVLFQRLTQGGEILRVAGAFFAPWILLYAPSVLWTWWQTGSPLGPLLTGVFGSSIYDAGYVHHALGYTVGKVARRFSPGYVLSLLGRD